MENYPVEMIPDAPPKEEQRSGLFRFLIDLLETFVLAALLFVAINAISARIRVDGYSMEPSLHNGEFVLVNKLAYQFGEPSTGDVIVFHFPRDPEQEYIKRIIGLPGDHVQVMNGLVFVNGEALVENYIASEPNYQIEWTVPENSLFVLGDNRNNSNDSHKWGPVPMDYVVGKAVFIYWPLTEWGLVHTPEVPRVSTSSTTP